MNAHERASGRDFDAHFVNTLTFKPELHAGDIEGAVHEVTHGVGFASRDDEILRVVLLEHLPHALDVVASVTPITLGVHVTEVQALLLASLDVGNREGDLTRDEGFPSSRRLVVEQDAVARVHVVRFSVVDHGPERHHLRHRIRRSRVEGRRLALRNLLHFTVQLGRRRLIKSRRLLLSG